MTRTSRVRFTIKPTTWWNADHFLAEAILAVLVQFRNADRNGHPARYRSNEAWNEDLDAMVAGFQLIADDDVREAAELAVIAHALDLFARCFRELWD